MSNILEKFIDICPGCAIMRSGEHPCERGEKDTILNRARKTRERDSRVFLCRFGRGGLCRRLVAC